VDLCHRDHGGHVRCYVVRDHDVHVRRYVFRGHDVHVRRYVVRGHDVHVRRYVARGHVHSHLSLLLSSSMPSVATTCTPW